MKNFKSISLLILVFVSCGVFCAEAQTRPQRTSSARAYYGEANVKPKLVKKKKQKVKNYTHTKTRKRNQGRCLDYQKKISAVLSCDARKQKRFLPGTQRPTWSFPPSMIIFLQFQ